MNYLIILSVIENKRGGKREMKNKKEEQEKKGSITFQFLPKKYSKCPTCGSLPKSYDNYDRNDWKETVRFKCGFSISSKTPNMDEPYEMCKKTKEWNKLKKNRLNQLEEIKVKIDEIIGDKRLKEEFQEKIRSLEHKIKDWWYT